MAAAKFLIGTAMNIKHFILTLILPTVLVFSADAKIFKQKENVCSEMKKAGLSIAKDEILVIGAVFKSQILKSRQSPYKFSESLAIVGGFARQANIENIQIVDCSSNFETIKNIISVDFRQIREGLKPDFEINGGKIIYVPSKRKLIYDFDFINQNLISRES